MILSWRRGRKWVGSDERNKNLGEEGGKAMQAASSPGSGRQRLREVRKDHPPSLLVRTGFTCPCAEGRRNPGPPSLLPSLLQSPCTEVSLSFPHSYRHPRKITGFWLPQGYRGYAQHAFSRNSNSSDTLRCQQSQRINYIRMVVT